MPDPYTYPGFDYDLSKLPPEKIMEQLAIMGQGGPLLAGTKATPKQQAGFPVVPPNPQNPQVASSPVAPPPVADGPEALPMPKQMMPQLPGMGATGGGSAGSGALDYGAQIQQLLRAGPGNDPDLWAKQVTGRRIAQGNREQEDQARQQQGISGFSQVPTIENLLRANFGGSSQYNWAPSDDQRAFAARQQLEQLKLASAGQSERDKLDAARQDAQTQREFQAGEGDKNRASQAEVANMQYGPASFKKNIYGSLLQENLKRFGNDMAAATAETEKQMRESEPVTGMQKPQAPGAPPGPSNPAAARINELLPQIGTFSADNPFTQEAAHRMLTVLSNSGVGPAELQEIIRRMNSGTFLGDPKKALGTIAQAYARSATYASGKNDVDLNLPDNASLFYQPRSVMGEMFRLPQHAVGAAVPNRIRVPTGEVFPTGDLPGTWPLSSASPYDTEQFMNQAKMAAQLLREMKAAQQGR